MRQFLVVLGWMIIIQDFFKQMFETLQEALEELKNTEGRVILAKGLDFKAKIKN